MAKQQARFVDGAVKKGVKKDDAAYIFELVDKFAGYGFNKSHAAAYALVSYHTAYLKANFREEFLAASMTLDMGNTDKLAMFASEAREVGIAILPPCVNASEVDFLAEPPAMAERGAIRYSLAALKNIGAQAVDSLVAERAANGPFKDALRFRRRGSIPRRSTSARWKRSPPPAPSTQLEPNRALVHGNVEQIWRSPTGSQRTLRRAPTISSAAVRAQPAAAGHAARQGLDADGAAAARVRCRRLLPLRPSARPYDERAGQARHHRYAEFEARADRGATAGRLAGIVVSARERRSQKGNKFAFAMFSEPTGQFEAVIFSETLGRLAEPAGAGHAGAAHGGSRARRRDLEDARAGPGGLGQGGRKH